MAIGPIWVSLGAVCLGQGSFPFPRVHDPDLFGGRLHRLPVWGEMPAFSSGLASTFPRTSWLSTLTAEYHNDQGLEIPSAAERSWMETVLAMVGCLHTNPTVSLCPAPMEEPQADVENGKSGYVLRMVKRHPITATWPPRSLVLGSELRGCRATGSPMSSPCAYRQVRIENGVMEIGHEPDPQHRLRWCLSTSARRSPLRGNDR
jgi:hypothetical protein